MSTAVRSAQHTDIQAIREVGIASWWATYTGLLAPRAIAAALRCGWSLQAVLAALEQADRIVLVAEDKAGEIVGVLFGTVGGMMRTAFIERLYLRPDQQGKGIGYALWSAYTAQLSPQAQTVELDVLVGNERAVSFYHRIGFSETHRFIDSVAGVPMPLIYMRADRPFL